MSWDDIKQNPPSNLKFSPLAMIPHKSRKYISIFDLLFGLKMARWDLPSVNKATNEPAPAEALDRVGTFMPCIIEELATDPF